MILYEYAFPIYCIHHHSSHFGNISHFAFAQAPSSAAGKRPKKCAADGMDISDHQLTLRLNDFSFLQASDLLILKDTLW